MSDTPSSLPTGLSHDLRRARKERDKVTTMTLRSPLVALDNAGVHTPFEQIGRIEAAAGVRAELRIVLRYIDL